MSHSKEEQTAKLFGADYVPSVPDAGTSTGDRLRNDSPPSDFPVHTYIENTLDESVLTTLKRDLVRIVLNLRLVLIPFRKRDERSRSLRNWDLWGPLVRLNSTFFPKEQIFIMILGIILSAEHKDSKDKVFTLTFVVIFFGAAISTLNVILLGGTIVFFQSLCLLGYSLFPLVIVAFIIFFVQLWYIVWPLTIIGVVWSTAATIPFMKEATPEECIPLWMDLAKRCLQETRFGDLSCFVVEFGFGMDDCEYVECLNSSIMNHF